MKKVLLKCTECGATERMEVDTVNQTALCPVCGKKIDAVKAKKQQLADYL